jgi:uncharacterized protein DUF6526
LGGSHICVKSHPQPYCEEEKNKMANETPQNFANHTRQVPQFVVGMMVLMVNLLGRLYELRYGITFRSVMDVLVGAVLIVLIVFVRRSAVTVQDRLIRLEMRLRLVTALPDMTSRIPEFTLDQLVALRFAGDAELPALARKVLDEKLNDRKAIKQLVKDWQADYLRA